MSKLQISESAVIAGPADRIYALLSDYRNGHPSILPRDTFQELQVEAGGVGAGTQFRLRSRVFGVVRYLRMTVTEPEPGRVLMESDVDSDLVTTFTVDPLPGSNQARVTLHSVWTPQRGLVGLLERFLITGVLRKVYGQELGLLAQQFTPAQGATATVR